MNGEGHVVCVAHHCDRVWKTNQEAYWRHKHWERGSPNEGPYRKTDHEILWAMNEQRICPHCFLYEINSTQSIKDLYEHEMEVHESEDTATIPGFVKLLRKGRIETEVRDLAKEPVHQRLLQKIMSWSGYHGPRGLAKFWHIESPDHEANMQKLEEKLTTPNRNMGREPYHPMTAEEFLSNEPLLLDGSPEHRRQRDFDWGGKRMCLKQWYDDGVI